MPIRRRISEGHFFVEEPQRVDITSVEGVLSSYPKPGTQLTVNAFTNNWMKVFAGQKLLFSDGYWAEITPIYQRMVGCDDLVLIHGMFIRIMDVEGRTVKTLSLIGKKREWTNRLLEIEVDLGLIE